MRPSLPYDDNADTLIAKVENMNANISLRKSKTTKAKANHLNHQNEADLDKQNTLKSLETHNTKLMQSKRVLDNGGKHFERQNFVRMNTNKKGAYKPAMRGAAFSNKLMSNKRNQMKFRNRMHVKLMQERAQTTVSAYGGLGAHGLDFGDAAIRGQGDHAKELNGSFSSSAMRYAPKIEDMSDEDEYLVNANMEDEIKEELKDIDK